MGNYVKGFILVVVLFFLVTFGLRNSQPVRVDYYFNLFAAEIPLYALIYFSLAVGILIGMTVGFTRRLGLGKTIKGLERQNRALQNKDAEEAGKAGTM